MKNKSSFYKNFKKKTAKDESKKHEGSESKRNEAKETMLESKGYVELKSGKMFKKKK
jgi:hypothetical protein